MRRSHWSMAGAWSRAEAQDTTSMGLNNRLTIVHITDHCSFPSGITTTATTPPRRIASPHMELKDTVHSPTPDTLTPTLEKTADTIFSEGLNLKSSDTDTDKTALPNEDATVSGGAESGEIIKEGGRQGDVRCPSRSLYTLKQVSEHCGPDSCWIILWDHVYDVTHFVREHPGGEDIIYEHVGRDATSVFRDVGHSNDALLMMMQYKVGVLVEEERIFKRHKMESLSY